MTDQLREALRVVFAATGAASVEIHSGDREPGMWIERGTIIPDVAKGDSEPTQQPVDVRGGLESSGDG